MKNSNERIRFRYGICLNESCEKCKSKEVQEVSVRKEFVCSNPECGKPLRECPPPKKGIDKKLILGVVAALVVIGIILFFVLSGGNNESAPITPSGPDTTVVKKNVSENTDSINAAKMAAENQRLKDSLEAIEKANAEKDKVKDKTTEEKPTKTVDNGNGFGRINLGYGTYEGYRKNNKPHGHGTIRYTKSHQIVSWKDYVASPGDTFEGEFREGKISGMGYWKHDGNITAIQ